MVDGGRLRVDVRVDALGAHFVTLVFSDIFVIVFGWESLSQHSGSAEEVHAHSSHAHTHTHHLCARSIEFVCFSYGGAQQSHQTL